MAVLDSILGVLPYANRGEGLADKLKVFLLISFETTSFANTARRARIKFILKFMADSAGLLTLHFPRDGHALVFKLRADEEGDLSVASEFIRAGYHFPDSEPA